MMKAVVLFASLLGLLFSAAPSDAQFASPLLTWNTVCTSTPPVTLAIDSQETGNVAHKSASQGPAGEPTSWSFTNTAGTYLFTFVDVTDGGGYTGISGETVTYGGASEVLLASFPNWSTDSGDVLQIWGLASPPTGANTEQISWSGGSTYDVLGANISFVGVNTATPLKNITTASNTSGTSTAASVALSGTASGDYVLTLFATGSGFGSPASPTTTSALLNGSPTTAGDNIAVGQQSTSGGTATAGYSVTADQWGALGVEVVQASASGGCTTTPAATSYALTGPATGTVGSPSTFTAKSNGKLTSPVTVTLNDSGHGGSFLPATITLAAGNFTSGSSAYTPAVAGTYNIAGTNSASLINPNPISFTASSASTGGYYVCSTSTCANANDANAGTLAAPFAGIPKCLSAMENSSTKVCYVRKGTYSLASTISLGSADNGETWQYYPPDGFNSATISGGGGVTPFNFNGVNGFTWNGIQFTGCAQNCFGTPSNPRNNAITIENSIFGGTSTISGGNATASGQITCDNCTNVTISHNYFFGAAGTNISLAAYGASDQVGGGLITGNYLVGACSQLYDCGSIYMDERNPISNGNNPGSVTISNNYLVGYGTSADQAEGIYLDDDTVYVTVTGNVIGPPIGGEAASYGNVLINGGCCNTIANNVVDLGSSGSQFITSWTAPGGGGAINFTWTAPNTFKNNIVISKYPGSTNTPAIGSNLAGTGYGNASNYPSTGVFANPIQTNAYRNFGGGDSTNITRGNAVGDNSPQQYNSTQIGVTCPGGVYAITAGSTVTGAPVNFPQLVGGWGPPGFTVSNSSVSC